MGVLDTVENEKQRGPAAEQVIELPVGRYIFHGVIGGFDTRMMIETCASVARLLVVVVREKRPTQTKNVLYVPYIGM